MSDRDRDVERRLERARGYFRAHHAGVEPDAAFAGRVVARLEPRTADLLGWAALRLLPATLALVLVLAWFSLRPAATTQVASADSGTSDDVLTWLLEEPGEVR